MRFTWLALRYASTLPLGIVNRPLVALSVWLFGRFRDASGWYGMSFFFGPSPLPTTRTLACSDPEVVVPSNATRLPYAFGALYPVGLIRCATATSSPPTVISRVPVPSGLDGAGGGGGGGGGGEFDAG